MTLDNFFLATIKDVTARIRSDDEYKLIRMAGLLRHLVLDGPKSLIHQVNKERKIKLQFTVRQIDAKNRKGESINYWGYRGFKTYKAYPKIVSLNGFLNHPFGFDIIHKRNLMIKDYIKHFAHVQGGVHSGKAKQAQDICLSFYIQMSKNESIPLDLKTLPLIAKTILTGLKPLKLAVQKK